MIKSKKFRKENKTEITYIEYHQNKKNKSNKEFYEYLFTRDWHGKFNGCIYFKTLKRNIEEEIEVVCKWRERNLRRKFEKKNARIIKAKI